MLVFAAAVKWCVCVRLTGESSGRMTVRRATTLAVTAVNKRQPI